MDTYGSGNQNRNDYDLGYWIVTIIFLISPLWFVGLILLLRKLTGRRDRARQARHPYDIQREQGAPGTQGMGNSWRESGPRPPARYSGERSGASVRTRGKG